MEELKCKECGHVFPVKAKYHAGLSDLGFLYSDKDTTVLTFNAYDPIFEGVAGRDCVPWQLAEEQQTKVERCIKPDSNGGRFSFSNPLKCPNCGHPLANPISKDIYFYVLDRRIDGEKESVWKDECRR